MVKKIFSFLIFPFVLQAARWKLPCRGAGGEDRQCGNKERGFNLFFYFFFVAPRSSFVKTKISSENIVISVGIKDIKRQRSPLLAIVTVT